MIWPTKKKEQLLYRLGYWIFKWLHFKNCGFVVITILKEIFNWPPAKTASLSLSLGY